MDCAKDLLELDSEVNNLNLLKEDDPFLPVLPSPEIPEELLDEGFKTPSVTPLHSPHAFLKEDRWLSISRITHKLDLILPPATQ